MSVTIDPNNPSRGHGDPPLPTDHPSFATVYNDTRRPSHPFLLPPLAPDEIGRLGSYRILRLLGQGGMGYVFQAEDISLRRPVALKVMRPELDQDDDGGERFLREARLMASIKHDHLVTVYQVGREGRVPYLAMELLQGESLDHWMKQSRTVSVADVLRLSREIVSGLAVIHGHGLIHRDVKPANIWLETPGGRVKILDFGLARIATDEARLTQFGMVLGTPAFMAPEQARGETVDARARPVQPRLHPVRAGERRAPLRGADHDGRTDRAGRERPSTAPGTPFFLAAGAVQPDYAAAGEGPARRPESAQAVQARLKKIEARLAARPAPAAASATAPGAAAPIQGPHPPEKGPAAAAPLADDDAGDRPAGPRRVDPRFGPARPGRLRPAEPGCVPAPVFVPGAAVGRFRDRLDADRRPKPDLGAASAARRAAPAARCAAPAVCRRPGPK